MRLKAGGLFKLFLGLGVLGGIAGSTGEAQQSTFSSASEAQAYLENNPRGPRAEEAFRYLVLVNLRSVDPAFQGLPPIESLDGIIRSDTVLSDEATEAAEEQLAAPPAAAGGVAATTAQDRFAQRGSGEDQTY